jgi:DNA-binding sugar fermentation-stimulating protein
LTNLELYHQHLTTIALTVNRLNRFLPQVHFDGTNLEFSIVDTAATDTFGDPVVVAEPSTFMEATETAYRWTLNPEKCYGNAWAGILS